RDPGRGPAVRAGGERSDPRPTPSRRRAAGRGVMACGGSARQPGQTVDHLIVGVAVRPVLAGLERLDDRVPRPVGVLRRVLVRRVVAAADVPAGHAEPQVDPLVSGFEALLAAAAARLDRFAIRIVELLEMGADVCHGDLRRRSSRLLYGSAAVVYRAVDERSDPAVGGSGPGAPRTGVPHARGAAARKARPRRPAQA